MSSATLSAACEPAAEPAVRPKQNESPVQEPLTKCPLVQWDESRFTTHKIVWLADPLNQDHALSIPDAIRLSWQQLRDEVQRSGQAILLLGPGYNDETLQKTCATYVPSGGKVLIVAGGLRTWNRVKPFAPERELASVSPAHALAQLRISGILVTQSVSPDYAQLDALGVRVTSPVGLAQTDSTPRFHLERLPERPEPADFLVSGGAEALLLQARLQAVDPRVRSAPLVRPCHLP